MSDPASPAGEPLEGSRTAISGEEIVERDLAEIETTCEEVAAGWGPVGHGPLAPEVRFLHVSRTIHQLVTDRNRSVGLFLGVAALLFLASTALLDARPEVVPMIPLKVLQLWCLPVTFGTLAVIGAFIGLILLRTRIGMIFEVAKMNALLGVTSDRARRRNLLSISFLMYLLVALLGGASSGLAVGMLLYGPDHPQKQPGNEAILSAETLNDDPIPALSLGAFAGVVYVLVFLLSYYVFVFRGPKVPSA